MIPILGRLSSSGSKAITFRAKNKLQLVQSEMVRFLVTLTVCFFKPRLTHLCGLFLDPNRRMNWAVKFSYRARKQAKGSDLTSVCPPEQQWVDGAMGGCDKGSRTDTAETNTDWQWGGGIGEVLGLAMGDWRGARIRLA